MANKIFSIYSTETPNGVEDGDQLILEVAGSHIACLVKSSKSTTIASFELFKLTGKKKRLKDVLTGIQPHSKLLQVRYSKAKVFVHNAQTVLVPAELFKSSNAADYLAAAGQFSDEDVARYEQLDRYGNLVNVYALSKTSLNDLNETLGEVEIQHTNSQILRTLSSEKSSTGTLYKVQFYGNHFIVAVVVGGQLHLVQSYDYQVPADVLYYLLNITEHINADVQTVRLEISGMIDLNSPLYKELEKYFRNVVVEEADSRLIHLDASEYPMHYFTPIFNLAL